MKVTQLKKSLAALLVSAMLLGAVGTFVGIGEAQDNPAAAAKDEKKPKKRAKPRGRLPAYCGKVVDSKQREQIYAIQKSHAVEITKLQAQLKELLSKRNAEVAAVLTTEQQTEVAKLVADAKEKRKKKASPKKAAGE
jgi:Spy/CpxP family protein refolding chaperone